MKKSELRQIIKEELFNEWWSDVDGMSKKEIQDLLIKSGFDKTKVKRASDDSLITLYDIAKRRGELKEELLKEASFLASERENPKNGDLAIFVEEAYQGGELYKVTDMQDAKDVFKDLKKYSIFNGRYIVKIIKKL